MKFIYFWFLLACLSVPFNAYAQTYVSNDVSGTWTKSSSPYIVSGDIRIRNGQSLQIESGVEVRFEAGYEFNVEGLLQAVGDLEDTITFTSNLADSTWGGIRFSSAHDSSRLLYCRIEHGSASNGGGIWVDETRLLINHCLIKDNSAENSGGGLYSYNSHVTIVNTSFVNNSANGSQYNGGGGLYSGRGYMYEDENILQISNSEFRNNTTSGEGGAIETGRGTYCIHGTRFLNNHADIEGGAIFGYDYLILNSLFFNNTSPSASTLRCGYSDYSIMMNSIIYDLAESSSTVELPYSDLLIINSITHNANFNEGNLTIEYSNIEGGWPGEGNINQDPRFVDPANADFHLLGGSPCSDAGNPYVLYNDLDGTRNDMGIYGGSDLFIEPLEIDFGPQGIGQTKTESFSIYNFRNSLFTIQSVQSADESNFSTATEFPRSIPAVMYDTVFVRFHPTVTGDIQSQLFISSSDFKGTSTLEIDLQGLGGFWSGPVSGIWRATDSPYIIGGNITVPASQSLVIEPGVVVQIDPSVAGGFARFQVFGSLEAVGTASDSIIFTVVPGEEEPEAWGGIDIEPEGVSKKSLADADMELAQHDSLLKSEQYLSAEEHKGMQLNRAVDTTDDEFKESNDREFVYSPLKAGTNSSHLSFCVVKYALTGITAMNDNVIIENSHILQNSDGVKWFGDEYSASGELRNNLIEKNTGYGVVCHAKCQTEYGYANPNIENNVIKQNGIGGIYLFADGDGPWSWYGTRDRAYVSPAIVGNEILENSGPAINCRAWGVWTNGIPLDHWSYAYVSPKIVGNIIVNNTQVLTVTCPNYDHSQGRLSLAEIEIDHATSWANGETEISASDSSKVSIHNSIFWGTAISNIQTTTGASIQISYSDFTQLYPGTGNIQMDPEFADTENNDFALVMTSPCIDTGDPSKDKDPDSTVADMGAKYYHQAISSFSLQSPSNDTTIATLTPVLNWNAASTAGGEALEYLLYYATDNSFPDSVTTIINSIEGNSTQITDALEDYQTYYWKILAKNPWSMQKWSSETWHFSINTDTVPPYFSQQLPELSFNEDESLIVPVTYWYDYIEDAKCVDTTLSISIHSGINVLVSSNISSHIFSAPENWYGTDTLQIVIEDRSQLSAHGQLIITVIPENDPPVITSAYAVNAYEDLPFNYTAKAYDPETSAVTYAFKDYPIWLTAGDSVISGIPPQGASDTSFVVIASDGELTDSLLVSVTVIAASTDISEWVIPENYDLKQNYPNPFNQETFIQYHLPEQSEVTLSIYNLVGEHIATLVNGEQKAGIYSLVWKGQTDSGEPVASGVYIYRFNTGKFTQVRKLLFMR
jgi:hypothetical protein